MYIFFKGIFCKNKVNSRTCFSKSKNPQFTMKNSTHELQAFVLGIMLGDAYITKYGRLQIDHSSYDYTKWKFDFLLRFNVVSKQTKISTVHRIHKRTKKPSISYRFYSKPCFSVALLIFKLCLNISKGQCRSVFYKEITIENKKVNKKILPKNIENLLINNLSLATWFMDDGGKGGLHGIIFSVHSFTNDEIEKLIYSLQKNFNISATLHSANTSRQLYILKKSISRFKQIISPFMIPTQRYKLL